MKLRIKFTKHGAMKFIGHLDMMRFFQKAVRRAAIDIAYSGGFSPHQIMSFASPLGVGLTSNGEYFDIELNKDSDSPTTIKQKLSEQMVEGIEIISVTQLGEGAQNAMASVAAAAYTVSFKEKAVLPTDWLSQWTAFLLSPEILYTKITRKVNRLIDLKPLIYKEKANKEDASIFLLINTSSANGIKPQFVIEAFFDYVGQTLPENAINICREEIYTNTGTAEKMNFTPLCILVEVDLQLD